MDSLKPKKCPECALVLHNSDYEICPECGFPFVSEGEGFEEQNLARIAAGARRQKLILFGIVLLGLVGTALLLNQAGESPGPDLSEPTRQLLNLNGPGGQDVERAKASSVKANMHTLQTMVETYAVDWGGLYPPDLLKLKLEAKKAGREYWRDFVNPVTGTQGIGAGGALIDAKDFLAGSDFKGFVLYEPLRESGRCVTGYRITGVGPDGHLIVNSAGGSTYTLSSGTPSTSQDCESEKETVLLGDPKVSPLSEPALTSPTPGSVTPAVPQTVVESGDIEAALKSWQGIKREAFVGKDATRLSEILTSEALTETQGALQWWIQNDASYHDIQLHDLKILSQNATDENTTEAAVEISETKDNSVQGRQTSTYKATYTLVKQDGKWLISRITAE